MKVLPNHDIYLTPKKLFKWNNNKKNSIRITSVNQVLSIVSKFKII
jgi:hypothetical protein